MLRIFKGEQMKRLVSLSILLTTSTFAQSSIDLDSFKLLLSQRQVQIERINQGMSKKIVSVTTIPTEQGPCELTKESIQTILKIEGQKIIVHSKETYIPAQTPACLGLESREIVVLFYDVKPNLANILVDLDTSTSQIRSIIKTEDIVTMNLQEEVETEDGTMTIKDIVVKYDLTMPSFKNLVYVQDLTQTFTVQDLVDIDVHTINLSNVLFCESAESDRCSEGDFSDILF